MEKRDKALKDYVNGMAYKDIAEKYGVSLSTVKSWKARHWGDATKKPKKKNATKAKKVATKTNKKRTQPTPKIEAPPEPMEELAASGLTDKQISFVMEYIRLENATQAYLNVYGSSLSTARNAGPKLTKHPVISKEIARIRGERLNALGINEFDILDDLASTARADLGNYVEFGSYATEETDQDGETLQDMNGKIVVKHKSWVALKDSNRVDTSLVRRVTVGKDGPQLELHERADAQKVLLDYLTKSGRFKKDADEKQNGVTINLDSFEKGEGLDNGN